MNRRSDTDATEVTQHPSPRRALHAYLSPAAHESWHEFAALQGVTVSALLEALSKTLDPAPERSVGDTLSWAVRQARVTDSIRRRRKR